MRCSIIVIIILIESVICGLRVVLNNIGSKEEKMSGIIDQNMVYSIENFEDSKFVLT